jgi:methylated-DNA-[protein]-cysteine S-methyltransferase
VTDRWAVIQTPWQPLTVVVDEADHGDVVVASWFGDAYAGRRDLADAVRVPSIDSVADAVSDWIDGSADAILGVPVRQAGGDFSQRAWAAMRDIPGGSVVTYGELARMAGRPRAARAAGTVCATNMNAPFVPCHRVVRSDGSLGQYGFGVDLKAALLAHERAI